MVMDIPRWASKYLNDASVRAIEGAVRDAESKTSVELVPVIVRRSSSIGHVSLCVTLVFWLLFLLLRVDHYQREYVGYGYWIWAVYILVSAIVTATLSRLQSVQRLFIHKQDQIAQVMRRAQLEFYQSKIQQTAEATGILFFISLLERHTVVLADRAIAEKFPPETWQGVVDTIVSAIRAGDLPAGMQRAIKQTENLLLPLFPITEGDLNELPNTLIIKE
jgi:putative membrane protein